MAEHRCPVCGNENVVKLGTCHMDEPPTRGEPVGFVHCPDCHTDTPWHLSHGQNHLVCSNRADRKYPTEDVPCRTESA